MKRAHAGCLVQQLLIHWAGSFTSRRGNILWRRPTRFWPDYSQIECARYDGMFTFQIEIRRAILILCRKDPFRLGTVSNTENIHGLGADRKRNDADPKSWTRLIFPMSVLYTSGCERSLIRPKSHNRLWDFGRIRLRAHSNGTLWVQTSASQSFFHFNTYHFSVSQNLPRCVCARRFNIWERRIFLTIKRYEDFRCNILY